MTSRFLRCTSVPLLVLATAISFSQAQEAPDAKTLMVRAHQARATWNGFPGFVADLVVCEDGKQAEGKIRVSPSGELKLELSDGFAWAERSLESLVAHRMGDEDRQYDVSFAQGDEHHPLGRLIRINDDALMGSQYRIQGDVIREVHRTMKDTRFTITVIDVARNPDGQYLPKLYTVSFWDTKTGDLKSTSVVRDQWIRVGKWDLPERLLTIESSAEGRRTVREMRLDSHHLLSTPGSTSP